MQMQTGCAKIATLIKQLDQTEINRIIAEEEAYRREQAERKAVASGETESVFGITGDNAYQDKKDNKNQ